MSTLHPNLARIAAAYDDTMERYDRGEMSLIETRRRLNALVARDDEGVQWSIDPVNGRWRYQDLQGRYHYGEPPTSGVASFTPHQLGPGAGSDPDNRIEFRALAPLPNLDLAGGRSGVDRRQLLLGTAAVFVAVVVVALLGL